MESDALCGCAGTPEAACRNRSGATRRIDRRLLNVSAIVLLLVGLSATHALAQPCTAVAAACAHWVSLGPSARSMVYATYPLGIANDRITRALVVVHGGGRDPSGAFRGGVVAATLAQRLQDTIVIAPRFASNQGACSDRLDSMEVGWGCGEGSSGGWRAGDVAVSHPGVNSFELMDTLLRQLSSRDLFPHLEAITVAGFSAGGQYVNRYASVNRVHDELKQSVTYVVGSPSSFLYPDPLRPQTDGSIKPYADARNCTTYNRWAFGLADRTGYAAQLSDEQLLRQLVSRPVTYLVGELENPGSPALDRSCPAMAQGDSRLSRAEAFFAHITGKYGARHKMMVVPECGHNLRCVLAADVSLPVLFPLSQ